MSASRIPPAAVYELAVAADRLPADLRLQSLEWGVLFAVTGRHTVAQIGGHLGLAGAERDGAFARLLELGLLAERPLSAGEYLRAAATVNGEPCTLAGFLRAGLAGPLPEPVLDPPPASHLELGGFEPLALPEEEIAMQIPDLRTPAPAPALSLRALMRFIAEQSGDADAGQLDIYRAFTRVSPQLLRRNGITTLRFEEDRLLTDPDLQEALLSSVEHVVGRSCPPEVFVQG
ncbi:MAG TPA: hypothetical protein VLT87_19055 [Thermoanaerobaculia bacterium]|nr:hypothetical protein [Thermoanaerobaculia bacterium]